MPVLTSPAAPSPCVWTFLTLEQKERVVQLMAQLAFNRIADQSGWFTKEAEDVQSLEQPKDSS